MPSRRAEYQPSEIKSAFENPAAEISDHVVEEHEGVAGLEVGDNALVQLVLVGRELLARGDAAGGDDGDAADEPALAGARAVGVEE